MQLITAKQVIDLCFTNKSTDTALIKDSFIEIAQEKHIRAVLGDDMYEEIVEQKNDDSLTEANKLLLETYLQPALAFYTKLEVIMDMNINTTSQGLMINETEFSRAANSGERADLKSTAQSHADTLRNKMLKFLEDNIDDYDSYEIQGITTDTTFIGGIIMDND